jgi:hypothetical protein
MAFSGDEKGSLRFFWQGARLLDCLLTHQLDLVSMRRLPSTTEAPHSTVRSPTWIGYACLLVTSHDLRTRHYRRVW